MFSVLHNGRILYNPRLQGFPVERPRLTRDENKFDVLTFTLYPQNPEYSLLDKKSSILSLYLDSTLVAEFIPSYRRRTFNGGNEFKCKNIISCLDDFHYRSLEFTGTASAFVDSILSEYNARVTDPYKITKGVIHLASVEYDTSEPETYWEALKTITDQNGGFLAPRFSNGNIYLDYLQEADLSVSPQKIVFGENMTDLFIETDTATCYSVLFPFGTDSDNNPVTIESVNNGKDYLENASAIELYGRREKKYTWTNVSSPSELLSLAQAKLSEISAQFRESVSLSVVDLHDADADISPISFLTLIDCVSAPHQYSHRYPITKIDIDLGEPKPANIILGSKPISLNDRINLERDKLESASRSQGRRLASAINEEKQRFDLKVEQDNEKFSILATDTEWDEMGNGHVTAFTHLTRTAHYVQDEARKELPFADWKAQYLAAHPEEAGKTDAQLREIYEAWITANPYAIYNVEYNDATRSERIISKTGINSLGQDETIMTRQLQEADRIGQVLGITSWTWEQVTPRSGDNPSTLKWYELVNGVYKRSTDTSVVSGKTYYVPKANLKESSALLYRNEDGQTVYYVRSDNIDMRASTLANWGVYSEDTLTAGVIAEKLSNSSNTYIQGDQVYIGDIQFSYSAATVTSISNPRAMDLFELKNGSYVLTKDESPVAGKTYYERSISATSAEDQFVAVGTLIAGKASIQELQSTYATITNLNTQKTRIDNLISGSTTATVLRAGNLYTTNDIYVGKYIKLDDGNGDIVKSFFNATLKFGANIEEEYVANGSLKIGLQASVSGGQVTISFADNSGGDHNSAVFNIADTQFYQDGVSAAYNNGWDAAAALTVPPSDGTGATFVFKAPKYYEKTQGNWVREQVDYTFTISKGTPSASGGYAAVTLTGHNQPAARIALDDWYNAGWDAAAALTVPPSDGTGATFVFKAPKHYEKTQGNWVREQVDYTFTISKGTPSASGGYAAVTLAGHSQPAARIALDDWYTAGKNDVTLGTDYNTNAQESTASTDQIKFLGKRDGTSTIDVNVGVRLTNGQQFSRWITDITVPSSGGGGSTADKIDLSSFTWRDSSSGWSTSGSTSLGTLSDLILQHKNDRGYIHFDATCTDGTGTKRYYITIG